MQTNTAMRYHGKGKVVSDKSEQGYEITVYPPESLSMVDGDVAGWQGVGGMTATVKATWIDGDSANRITAPNVTAGEEVKLYSYGETGQFFWQTERRNSDLRGQETTVDAIKNSPGSKSLSGGVTGRALTDDTASGSSSGLDSFIAADTAARLGANKTYVVKPIVVSKSSAALKKGADYFAKEAGLNTVKPKTAKRKTVLETLGGIEGALSTSYTPSNVLPTVRPIIWVKHDPKVLSPSGKHAQTPWQLIGALIAGRTQIVADPPPKIVVPLVTESVTPPPTTTTTATDYDLLLDWAGKPVSDVPDLKAIGDVMDVLTLDDDFEATGGPVADHPQPVPPTPVALPDPSPLTPPPTDNPNVPTPGDQGYTPPKGTIDPATIPANLNTDVLAFLLGDSLAPDPAAKDALPGGGGADQWDRDAAEEKAKYDQLNDVLAKPLTDAPVLTGGTQSYRTSGKYNLAMFEPRTMLDFYATSIATADGTQIGVSPSGPVYATQSGVLYLMANGKRKLLPKRYSPTATMASFKADPTSPLPFAAAQRPLSMGALIYPLKTEQWVMAGNEAVQLVFTKPPVDRAALLAAVDYPLAEYQWTDRKYATVTFDYRDTAPAMIMSSGATSQLTAYIKTADLNQHATMMNTSLQSYMSFNRKGGVDTEIILDSDRWRPNEGLQGAVVITPQVMRALITLDQDDNAQAARRERGYDITVANRTAASQADRTPGAVARKRLLATDPNSRTAVVAGKPRTPPPLDLATVDTGGLLDSKIG